MARTPSTMLELGTQAPDFTLADPINGGSVSLSDFSGKPLVVAFICNHCPYVKHIGEEFGEFAREYRAKGVAVVAINSNDAANYPDDAPEKMEAAADDWGFTFPYLYDETQEVAKAYQAACTPDLYLFDAEHKLVYRGQFDDSRPRNEEPVTGGDLRAACDALLKGKPIDPEQIPSLGCNVKWKPGNEPDYFG